MGKVAITQSEVSQAVDQIARELREAHQKAQETLARVGGDVCHIAYRVQAGEVMGMRSSLTTLEAYLGISPEAIAALDFFDSHPLQLIG